MFSAGPRLQSDSPSPRCVNRCLMTWRSRRGPRTRMMRGSNASTASIPTFDGSAAGPHPDPIRRRHEPHPDDHRSDHVGTRPRDRPRPRLRCPTRIGVRGVDRAGRFLRMVRPRRLHMHHSRDGRPSRRRARFDMVSGDGTLFTNRFDYLEIVPCERLVMDHGSDIDDDPTRFRTTVTSMPRTTGRRCSHSGSSTRQPSDELPGSASARSSSVFRRCTSWPATSASPDHDTGRAGRVIEDRAALQERLFGAARPTRR